MAAVVFQHVAKVYPDGTRAVDDLTLAVRDGEFVVIVGPSGSGKTTALRMVAGLEEISEGTISIGDRVVNHVPARDRNIAMVFQSYALYPHLSAFENIAFGLKVKKVPEASSGGASSGRPSCWTSRNSSSASLARCREVSGSASQWVARSCASLRSF